MAEVRLSAPERAFLLQGIEQGMREDGRGRHDFRSFELETGLAPQTNGSARLLCPHAHTDIMVGVKLEIAPPKVRALRAAASKTYSGCSGALDPPMITNHISSI